MFYSFTAILSGINPCDVIRYRACRFWRVSASSARRCTLGKSIRRFARKALMSDHKKLVMRGGHPRPATPMLPTRPAPAVNTMENQ